MIWEEESVILIIMNDKNSDDVRGRSLRPAGPTSIFRAALTVTRAGEADFGEIVPGQRLSPGRLHRVGCQGFFSQLMLNLLHKKLALCVMLHSAQLLLLTPLLFLFLLLLLPLPLLFFLLRGCFQQAADSFFSTKPQQLWVPSSTHVKLLNDTSL